MPGSCHRSAVSWRYRLMYRVGFVPWDTGRVGAELEAVTAELPPGRALDLGCGTGTQAVHLASHGWTVTGVDAVPRALRAARARAEREGVTVEWVRADVGRLDRAGIAAGFSLVHDRGCFHGLDDEARAGWAHGVTGLASPGATLLLMCFEPNRGVGPAGADREEVERRLPEWELISAEPDRGPPPSGPMRDVARWWYRLRRR